jgi:hypothetical protein
MILAYKVLLVLIILVEAIPKTLFIGTSIIDNILILISKKPLDYAL